MFAVCVLFLFMCYCMCYVLVLLGGRLVRNKMCTSLACGRALLWASQPVIRRARAGNAPATCDSSTIVVFLPQCILYFYAVSCNSLTSDLFLPQYNSYCTAALTCQSWGWSSDGMYYLLPRIVAPLFFYWYVPDSPVNASMTRLPKFQCINHIYH